MEDHPMRVVLVEDDPVDALLVQRGLGKLAEGRYLIDHATTLREGLEHLAKRSVDVVVLDLHLPDADGLEAVEEMMGWLREHELPVPVVVLTGSTETEMALAALRSGAQDYVVKDELRSYTVLQRALHYAIERQRVSQHNLLLEERLRRSEQLEGAGVLAAGVAFSFHILLGRMLDEVDKAMDELGGASSSGGVGPRLLEIRRHLLVASDVSDQLKSWMAASSPLPATDIDPSAFVLEMAKLFELIVQPPVEIQYHLPRELPRISFHPIELRKVLLALVMNAVQAIGQQPGRIELETGVLPVNDELLARTQGADLAPGDFVFFSVADDGAGLPLEVRTRVFDPFFTTRSAGRGLGLFMTLGAVRRHSGAILCSSEAGRGTRFTVLLPPNLSTPAPSTA